MKIPASLSREERLLSHDKSHVTSAHVKESCMSEALQSLRADVQKT